MSISKLGDHDYRHNGLRSNWKKAQNQIILATKSAGLSSYQILETTEDEVRLRVCGAVAYIRFKHNLEQGFIEYGAIKTSPSGELKQYIKVETLTFDLSGNVNQKWGFDAVGGGSFESLHIQVLARSTPEILAAYFELIEISDSPK